MPKLGLKKYPEPSVKRLYNQVKKRGYTGSKRTVRMEAAKIRRAGLTTLSPRERMLGEKQCLKESL